MRRPGKNFRPGAQEDSTNPNPNPKLAQAYNYEGLTIEEQEESNEDEDIDNQPRRNRQRRETRNQDDNEASDEDTEMMDEQDVSTLQKNEAFETQNWWEGLRETILRRGVDKNNQQFDQTTVQFLRETRWWHDAKSLRKTMIKKLGMQVPRTVSTAGGKLGQKYKLGQKRRVAQYLADEYGHPGYFCEKIRY